MNLSQDDRVAAAQALQSLRGAAMEKSAVLTAGAELMLQAHGPSEELGRVLVLNSWYHMIVDGLFYRLSVPDATDEKGVQVFVYLQFNELEEGSFSPAQKELLQYSASALRTAEKPAEMSAGKAIALMENYLKSLAAHFDECFPALAMAEGWQVYWNPQDPGAGERIKKLFLDALPEARKVFEDALDGLRREHAESELEKAVNSVQREKMQAVTPPASDRKIFQKRPQQAKR